MAPPPPPGSSPSLSSAHLLCFAPQAMDNLLVVTSGEGSPRLLKFSVSSGQLLSEVMYSVHWWEEERVW